LRKRFESYPGEVKAAGETTGKVALYATCYCNVSSPDLGEDFVKVFEHNGVQIDLVPNEVCCGMPKLELGDLDRVDALKRKNIPALARLVDEGYDLVAPIPSCVLMYKQELPLMYPDDPDVRKVQAAFYDPFEYLFLRHRQGLFNTEFKTSLGDISYQVACHLRVQNVGIKTRDILNLVPDTTVHAIERCSGHDGTYAVKKETRDNSVKIARPVVRQVDQKEPDHFASDCPMAATQIAHLSEKVEQADHPMSLLRKAYGI
jgi:Fe-S oxidoreductase